MKTRLSDLLTIPRIAALSVLAFVVLLIVLTKLTTPPEFDFLAGPEDSTFYRDAMRFKDILMRDGVRLNVIETRGSLDNLRLLLEAEEPTAAFMDAVGAIELAETEAARNSGADPEDVVGPFEQLTSLGAIYLQPVWIFVLADSVLEGVEDMNEARLGAGPEGSTSRMLAELFLKNVLEAISVAPEEERDKGPKQGDTGERILGVVRDVLKNRDSSV